jgi:hypothetical protein
MSTKVKMSGNEKVAALRSVQVLSSLQFGKYTGKATYGLLKLKKAFENEIKTLSEAFATAAKDLFKMKDGQIVPQKDDEGKVLPGTYSFKNKEAESAADQMAKDIYETKDELDLYEFKYEWLTDCYRIDEDGVRQRYNVPPVVTEGIFDAVTFDEE